MWPRGLCPSQNDEDKDGNCFLESHLFTDVHLCERYEPLQQFLFLFLMRMCVRVPVWTCV